jgi:DNA-binding FrmR family transcriptional regulator
MAVPGLELERAVAIAARSIAQQLHAVEKAIQNAKKLYIHDHIDNCLEDIAGSATRQARNSLAEFRKSPSTFEWAFSC